MPTRIAEIPLIDMNFVDFSMSSLMSCNVSTKCLVYTVSIVDVGATTYKVLIPYSKSSLRYKVKIDFLLNQ